MLLAKPRRRLLPIMQAVLLVCGTAVLYTLPLTIARAQTATVQQQYDIVAGELAPALRSLASAAGVALTFTADQTDGKHTQGIHGQYTLPAAFAALLSGTSLYVVQLGNGGYVLRSVSSVDIAATGNDTVLPAVVVHDTGRLKVELPVAYAGGQVARGGRLGVLGSTDFMDSPFSQSSYTSSLVANQQAQTLADVLANDSAVQDTGARFGPTGSGLVIRGFSNSSALGAVTFNGLQAGSMYKQSAELYERIELIKGLDTFLNGMAPSGYLGGSINLVPKRAQDEPLTQLTASVQSDAQLGLHVDVARRFGENKAWGIRYNGLYRDGQTAWRERDVHLVSGILGIDYRGDRLRASLDLLHQKTTITNTQPVVVFATDTIPQAPSPDSPILLGQSLSQKDKSAVFRFDYDFNANLTGFAGFSRSRFDSDNTGAAIVQSVQPDGSFVARVRNLPYAFDNDNYQTGLRALFNTGLIHHRAVLSVDYVYQQSAIREGNSGWGDFVSGNLNSTTTAVRPSFASVAPWEVNSVSRLGSIALADTLSFNQDRISITLGARKQKVDVVSYGEPYKESAVTPMAGVVIKPWQMVSLYANYIEGLQPGSVVTDATAPNYGQVFPPYRSKQYEIGFKQDFGKLATTVSAFQIAQPSLLQDPATLRYNLDGQQRNRGLEWNVFGKASQDVSILGGVSYTQAVLSNTQNGANNGKTAIGVARIKANLGVQWYVPGISGLSLNGRAVYTGPVYLNTTNTQQLPSWTRYDAGARYETQFGNTPVTLRANVENLLNKGYWLGTTNGFAMLSAPRTFMLSATVDF